MRAIVGFVFACLFMSACSLPFTQSSNEKKAECDRIAAQAIQTKSLEDAKTLSARASACYAQLQGS